MLGRYEERVGMALVREQGALHVEPERRLARAAGRGRRGRRELQRSLVGKREAARRERARGLVREAPARGDRRLGVVLRSEVEPAPPPDASAEAIHERLEDLRRAHLLPTPLAEDAADQRGS